MVELHRAGVLEHVPPDDIGLVGAVAVEGVDEFGFGWV